MRNGKRGRYTLGFKQEAVRLLQSGQSIAETGHSLSVEKQTPSNGVKAHREGKLNEVSGNLAQILTCTMASRTRQASWR